MGICSKHKLSNSSKIRIKCNIVEKLFTPCDNCVLIEDNFTEQVQYFDITSNGLKVAKLIG